VDHHGVATKGIARLRSIEGIAMSKLVKLEKMLERSFDRLRRKDTPQELVEILPEILDDVEDRLEASGGKGRVFPYDRVVIALRAAGDDRIAARGLFQDMPERIRQRLRLKGCEPPAGLEVKIRFAAPERDEAWGERMFRIQYRRARPGAAKDAPPAAAPAPAPTKAPLVRFTVLRGKGGQKEFEHALARVNLGRLEKVASTTGRGMRRNHVWFAEGEDTVSRAHAHIDRVGTAFSLFDDGSAGGTRILRDGEEIDVMPNASRGVRLKDGDRVELGRKCVVEVRVGSVG
jgi:hypothetical protein